jgi:hypothetical protein
VWAHPAAEGIREPQYDSETTIAAPAGKVKRTFESLLNVRDFLERQVGNRIPRGGFRRDTPCLLVDIWKKIGSNGWTLCVVNSYSTHNRFPNLGILMNRIQSSELNAPTYNGVRSRENLARYRIIFPFKILAVHHEPQRKSALL